MSEITPLRQEKDYVLEYLQLVIPRTGAKYDISEQLIRLTYEENIFMGIIHGSLLMVDAVDYPTLIPFIGEEEIHFSLTRQDEMTKNSEDVRLLPSLKFR